MNAQLQERLEAMKARIHAAASRAGRAPSEVTLIAVSKTFPVPDIEAVSSLAQVDFGENKVQELVAKMDALGRGSDTFPIRWHLIGHLQRNKAREVAGRIDLFHALDSERLGQELQKRLEATDAHLACLIQVNVSGEASKFGVEPADLDALVDRLQPLDRIRLSGLMTLASPVEDPEAVRGELALLRRLGDSISDRLAVGQPLLSMGMSGDFEVAIEEGATHVRIGSAIFGSR
ncbi:MAG: YggS family pyridoxal phosphate-dependent enzyme [Bacteroidetes bacterium]|nr:YggS family pyridoxal phosphate-dependent enzyme [Bacteroidota bacterium]MDA0873546.1 YggS family pyridoxal phosphate-dependent enzyme [Bacteroidota bacterium]